MNQRSRETVSQDAFTVPKGLTISVLLVPGPGWPLAEKLMDAVAEGGQVPGLAPVAGMP